VSLDALLEEVTELIRGQVAAAPRARPARALGPIAWRGRGRGIRSLNNFVDQTRIVESKSQREELAHRLRLTARPFLWDSHYLERRGASVASRVKPAWARAPIWYWDVTVPDHIAPSIAWDAVATRRYVDIPDDTEPSSRGALWPLWLVLGQPKFDFRDPLLGNHGSAGLPTTGMPQPAVIPEEELRVTLLGAVARAWIDWNRVRRVQRGGRPIGEWAAPETGSLDLQKLRAAVARRAPREDLMGCINVLVMGRMFGRSAMLPIH